MAPIATAYFSVYSEATLEIALPAQVQAHLMALSAVLARDTVVNISILLNGL
jgi:hypothetical protein